MKTSEPEASNETATAAPWLRHVLKALSRFSVYQAVLPYNLNWIRSFRFMDAFLRQHPITVIDVGARGGSCDELAPLQRHVDLVGFDADAEECRKLNSGSARGYRSFTVHPYFVGASSGPQSFNLYNNLAESSQRLPNAQFRDSFNPNLGVDRVVTVEGTTLDQFVGGNAIEVDFIKLDTQGTEFEILSNGKMAMKQALMIECEVAFTEIYQDQKLFHDISGLLHENGFSLLYLNRVFGSMKSFEGLSRGQLIFGDALFGLNKTSAGRLSWQRQKKYCALLINYGHLDLAFEIFRENEDLRINSPELHTFFADNARRRVSLGRKLRYAFWAQIEKLLFLVLCIRKTNQLSNDSDRSWPIR